MNTDPKLLHYVTEVAEPTCGHGSEERARAKGVMRRIMERCKHTISLGSVPHAFGGEIHQYNQRCSPPWDWDGLLLIAEEAWNEVRAEADAERYRERSAE